MASKLAFETTIVTLGVLAHVAPVRVGRFYARKFCTPARRRASAWETEILAGAEVRGHFDGCAYAEWGKGPTILLIHGWEGRGSQLGRFVGPLVEAGFRVVAWDAPAHGGSEGEITNLARAAEAFSAFASAQGPVYGIVAHSFGGMIARLAIALGLEVERFVQIASPARVQQVFDEFTRLVRLPRRAAGAFQNEIEKEAGIAASEIDALLAHPWPGTASLAIHCRDDSKVSIREAEELVAVTPGFTLREFKGYGHSRILLAKDVIGVVSRFMERGRSAAPDLTSCAVRL